MQRSFKKILKKKRGFALLLSVVIAGLLLTVGLALSLLANKEFTISTTTRDSQLAYFAAQSGINCVRKHSNLFSSAFNQVIQPATLPVAPDTFRCNSENQTATFSNDEYTVEFQLKPQPYYVIITIKKDEDNRLIAEAKGYNVRPTLFNRKVERKIVTTLEPFSCFIGVEDNPTKVQVQVNNNEINKSPSLLSMFTFLGTKGYKNAVGAVGADLDTYNDQKNYKHFETKSEVTMKVRYLGKGLLQTVDFGYYTNPSDRVGTWQSLKEVTGFTCSPDIPGCPVDETKFDQTWTEFPLPANTQVYFGFRTDIEHESGSGNYPGTTNSPYLTNRFYSTDPTLNTNDGATGDVSETNDIHVISFGAFHTSQSSTKPFSYIIATEALPHYDVWDPNLPAGWKSSDNGVGDFNDVIYEVQFVDCIEEGIPPEEEGDAKLHAAGTFDYGSGPEHGDGTCDTSGDPAPDYVYPVPVSIQYDVSTPQLYPVKAHGHFCGLSAIEILNPIPASKKMCVLPFAVAPNNATPNVFAPPFDFASNSAASGDLNIHADKINGIIMQSSGYNCASYDIPFGNDTYRSYVGSNDNLLLISIGPITGGSFTGSTYSNPWGYPENELTGVSGSVSGTVSGAGGGNQAGDTLNLTITFNDAGPGLPARTLTFNSLQFVDGNLDWVSSPANINNSGQFHGFTTDDATNLGTDSVSGPVAYRLFTYDTDPLSPAPIISTCTLYDFSYTIPEEGVVQDSAVAYDCGSGPSETAWTYDGVGACVKSILQYSTDPAPSPSGPASGWPDCGGGGGGGGGSI